MSTLNRYQLKPRYPAFSEHGYVPKPAPFGPPDMWPSGLNSGYSVYAGAYQRNLAGVEAMNAEGIDVYPNELNLLAAADDVSGNGVFDPNGTHGNLHKSEGVFNDHQSLPGYVDREVFYQPGEVQDITGGGTTMYVPGGAVAFQQGQTETLRANRLLWELPNAVRPEGIEHLRQQNIVNAPTATQSIGEWNENQKRVYTLAAVGGVAAGLLLLAMMRKK